MTKHVFPWCFPKLCDVEFQKLFLLDVPTNLSEVPDDDFDRTVSGEQWIGVSEAVINQNKDELVSRLQEINNIVENQRLVNS